MKRSTLQDKPKPSFSFAYVQGEQYRVYVKSKGEDSLQAKYFLSFFPDEKEEPEAYKKFKSEFDKGEQAQKDLEPKEK